MSERRLDRVLTSYRIGDANGRYRIFDATGSTLAPGRWNSPACAILYSSEHYSTAMLERLVHGGGQLPPNQHFIKITIPNGATYEVLNPAHLPDWQAENRTASRAHGDVWQKSKRSLILVVPSLVAREESNILINPQHSEFSQVEHGLETPVRWDERLFAP